MSRRLLLIGLVLAACGGDTGGDSAPEGPAAEAPAPPLDPDIWVAELVHHDDGSMSLGQPTAAIHRPGYDNQPYFTPDGRGFWFAALDEHTAQTDIWRYDLTGAIEQVVMTAPESEYSPTPLPDGTGLSVIRVEADSTQRLWRAPFDGSESAPILPDLAPIGYHAWITADRVAVFVLGNPPTLRIAHVSGGPAETVAEGIGRSIQKIPGEPAVSFVRMVESEPPSLMRYDSGSGTVEALVQTVGGGDFHAWTPDGTVLMADGPRIWAWTPGPSSQWVEIADLSERRVRVTRLAVSPDGRQIALVVEPGDVLL